MEVAGIARRGSVGAPCQRAGRNLPKKRSAALEQAKGKLHEAFGRPP